jgi:MraZ protein
MINLLGEYECKLDAKGRCVLPSGLKKQLESVVREGFVINRDVHEKCLVLYPKSEWDKTSRMLSRLNRFVKKNALFIRKFNNGATPVECDNLGRINIPNHLAASADLQKDMVVVGNGDRVELWNRKEYKAMLENKEIDFSNLAEDVMGSMPAEDDAV